MKEVSLLQCDELQGSNFRPKKCLPLMFNCDLNNILFSNEDTCRKENTSHRNF